MNKTKIEWCDCTVNPVLGCTYGCPFCYARRMNQRFGWIDDFAKPQFFPERLKLLDSKKPKIIFMDSMSDIADWKQEWREETFRAMRHNSQHIYLFLTKRPQVYEEIFSTPGTEFPSTNCWFGWSQTKPADGTFNMPKYLPTFASIEPILVPFKNPEIQADWVIIGAETGNRKGKVIPKREWIESIVNECRKYGIPVFMKGSLKDIWGEPLIQEFPESFNGEDK